jgi:hypothetical protein
MTFLSEIPEIQETLQYKKHERKFICVYLLL